MLLYPVDFASFYLSGKALNVRLFLLPCFCVKNGSGSPTTEWSWSGPATTGVGAWQFLTMPQMHLHSFHCAVGSVSLLLDLGWL